MTALRDQQARAARLSPAIAWHDRGDDMPFIRLDEDGFEMDDPTDEMGDGHYTGPFNYCPAAEYAYKPHPFEPAGLSPVPAAVYAALLARGAARFRVTYDGGHDEGFAHADAVWFGDAARPADAVAADLAGDAALVAALDAAGRERHAAWVARYNMPQMRYAFDDQTPAQVVRDVLDELAQNVAGSLLGDGFGTGECSIFGACIVDLRTNRIEDDPNVPIPPNLD
jgi:hypothetical protein